MSVTDRGDYSMWWLRKIERPALPSSGVTAASGRISGDSSGKGYLQPLLLLLERRIAVGKGKGKEGGSPGLLPVPHLCTGQVEALSGARESHMSEAALLLDPSVRRYFPGVLRISSHILHAVHGAEVGELPLLERRAEDMIKLHALCCMNRGKDNAVTGRVTASVRGEGEGIQP